VDVVLAKLTGTDDLVKVVYDFEGNAAERAMSDVKLWEPPLYKPLYYKPCPNCGISFNSKSHQHQGCPAPTNTSS